MWKWSKTEVRGLLSKANKQQQKIIGFIFFGFYAKKSNKIVNEAKVWNCEGEWKKSLFEFCSYLTFGRSLREICQTKCCFRKIWKKAVDSQSDDKKEEKTEVLNFESSWLNLWTI